MTTRTDPPTTPIDQSTTPSGAGLGFRLAFADELLSSANTNARFIEVAPENYLAAGGRRSRLLHAAAERWPVVSHGLCGDFAGATPIDEELLAQLAQFLRETGAHWYSDHLCLTAADGVELHDLLPLPFSEAAVRRAGTRIREVRERLELPIAIENVSAYLRMPGAEMEEPDFVRAVLEDANCLLLLDVNNVYVNSQNFSFDPDAYVDALPLERVVQIHMAGHRVEDDGLLIDTHGAPIVDPVYALLKRTLPKIYRQRRRPVPVLLERDNSFPPLVELEAELARLQTIVDAAEVNAAQEVTGFFPADHLHKTLSTSVASS